MSEAPTDNGDSPVMIQEAESSEASPQSGQGSPHSPDSTVHEEGSQAQASTSVARSESSSQQPAQVVQQRQILASLLSGNADINENLATRVESSSDPVKMLPDSPSRKREGETCFRVPFSPTKKLKSPKK